MNDVLCIITETYVNKLTDLMYAEAFVKMQAVSRVIRNKYMNDSDVWMCLLARYKPRNMRLPRHMGLRRKAMYLVRVLVNKCGSCAECVKVTSAILCTAFNMVLCRPCFTRVMIADDELIATGVTRASEESLRKRLPYVSMNDTDATGLKHRRRFYMRSHIPSF